MYQNAFQSAPAKTYCLSDLPSLVFGEEFDFFGDSPIEFDSQTQIYYVHLKLKNDPAVCPHCAVHSEHPHDYPVREVQMIPLNSKTVIGLIHTVSWECRNPECSCRTFSSSMEGVESYAHRSLALNCLIFSIALFCSASAAAIICRDLGIRISDDSILRMYKRIEITDDPDVEFIGVDDVAVRKGQTYYTVIYDGKTHHLIGMLEGRDGEALKEWLKSHRKVNMITRDRAGAYAKAISEILPDCMQIADKFHLFQNLIGYLKDIFKEQLPKNFYIKDDKVLPSEPEKVWSWLKPMTLEQAARLNYDNSDPLNPDGTIIKFDSKNRNPNRLQYQRQAEGRQKKYETALKIRQEWSSPCGKRPTKKALSEKYGISMPVVTKYLNMTDEEVEKIKDRTVYRKRHTDMDDYLNIVYKMLADGHKAESVFSYILSQGYSGSMRSLEDHIRMIVLNNFGIVLNKGAFRERVFPEDVEVISRHEIFKYMTIRDKEKMSGSKAAEHYESIKSSYPIIALCEEIWNDFTEVMDSGDPDTIDSFIQKNDEGPVESFINGLNRDIAPVKNAISHSETSGFVEGGNCRFKQTKRTMFGRCGLDLLFRKTYAISSIFHLGKTAKEISRF